MTRREVNPCVHYRDPPPEGIGERLARLYRDTLKEPNPDWAEELLAKLK